MTRQSLWFANLIVYVAVFALTSLTLASAQTESVIHGFQSTSVFDGIAPLSGVVADSSGALYGTTTSGGKYRAGTVYKLTPPVVQGGAWKQTILYAFTGGSDGAYPSGALVLGKTRKIYGTTQAIAVQNTCGNVYELSPPTKPGNPWTEAVLYKFCSTAGDGDDPIAGVISDSNGRLYGTTYKGGFHKAGNVFVLSPPAQKGGAWKERNLYSFNSGNNGKLPFPSGLALDAAGALYGMLEDSEEGGFNPGSVFQLIPPLSGSGAWTETVLYAFSGTADGYGPVGGPVFDSSGILYGATVGGGQYGAGSAFSLTPPATQGGAWTESVLYSFTGFGDGLYPDSSLVFDSAGALYGVTQNGGIQSCGDASNGCGTAFKLVPPSAQGGAWTEETLHSFAAGADGANPESPLLVLGTGIFGTTAAGGAQNCQAGPTGCGTVFEITQ